jgi:DNA-binding MarR family transcriptional regulator
MPRLADLAASIDEAADALVALLDPARFGDLIQVSPTQLRVLTLLHTDPAIIVNGLAHALLVNASSASRLCDRLEAMGFLRRQSDPHDRREVRLQLTPAGHELLAHWRRHRREALLSVLTKMPTGARQDLMRSLRAFSSAADELLGVEVHRAAPGVRRTA